MALLFYFPLLKGTGLQNDSHQLLGSWPMLQEAKHTKSGPGWKDPQWKPALVISAPPQRCWAATKPYGYSNPGRAWGNWQLKVWNVSEACWSFCIYSKILTHFERKWSDSQCLLQTLLLAMLWVSKCLLHPAWPEANVPLTLAFATIWYLLDTMKKELIHSGTEVLLKLQCNTWMINHLWQGHQNYKA